VLNLNIKQWFSRPAEGVRLELIELGNSIESQFHLRLTAQAHWLASLPENRGVRRWWRTPRPGFRQLLRTERHRRGLPPHRRPPAANPLRLRQPRPRRKQQSRPSSASPCAAGGTLVLAALLPIDLDTTERDISRYVADYDQLSINRKETRQLYLTYLALITLFILFVAAWVALYLARQITEPIIALLTAAREVRGGNLKHRIQVGAIDELATLVRAFNDMTQALETSSRELEARRRFTETILESIPTGVISVAPDGRLRDGEQRPSADVPHPAPLPYPAPRTPLWPRRRRRTALPDEPRPPRRRRLPPTRFSPSPTAPSTSPSPSPPSTSA
jgi:nitrogen fixation/metabolism regulation signal transduction histidine kinase